MIYFKAFSKNKDIKEGSIIGNLDNNGELISIYMNPIFVINPKLYHDIFIVKPVGKTEKNNGDAVKCRVIKICKKISVEDIISLDIDIKYKLNIVKLVFDKDVQKRYDLFNQLIDIDDTGEMLYSFAKCFPNAINHKLMYNLIKDRDFNATYLSKFTILYDGYNSLEVYNIALSNRNHRAIVDMALHGLHSELAVLNSELIRNCNDILVLYDFLLYVRPFKVVDTRLLEHKIKCLNTVYEFEEDVM